jgi:hypothetical protein
MKWFDETAYDAETGEGTIAFLDEERKWIQPGDGVLLQCEVTGLWGQAIVASNDHGQVQAYWEEQPGMADGEQTPQSDLARTMRLPKGFLIHPKYHLEHYSEQLYAREENDGQHHPPPFAQATDAKKILFVKMVILLHDDFPERDVNHRSLKHRCVNDVLYALPLLRLKPSARSTDHGMWIKDFERCIGDLRHMKGLAYRFRTFDPLAEVVPAETIRWIGSEEAYRAILAEFKSYIALFPEFKSYNNHKKEPLPLPSIIIETTKPAMSDDLGKKFDDFMREHKEREKEREEREKAASLKEEQREKELADLRKKVAELEGKTAPASPPDLSGEFKADLKAVLRDQLDGPFDAIFTTEVVVKAVAEKWAAKTDHLGFLQIDKKKNVRTDFRDFVYAALMELWHAKEIQRLKAENPSPEAGQSKVNDWFWSILKNPVHCV